MRRQPDAFPKDLRMLWEPRVGDVAASGDLGYLTGPVESTMPGQPVRYATYFSVWKKQANGEYRVILDIGSGFPGKPEFPPALVRSAAKAAYTGPDTKAATEASLLAADKTIGDALSAKGAATAYAAALHAAARVHRPGHPSMTTRDSAVEWMRAHVTAMSSTPLKGETAASRDLGYTWGSWTATDTTGKSARGYYVRVWTRAADGTWQLAADVTEASR
jgi:ketosteroid isomerase-like protein